MIGMLLTRFDNCKSEDEVYAKLSKINKQFSFSNAHREFKIALTPSELKERLNRTVEPFNQDLVNLEDSDLLLRLEVDDVSFNKYEYYEAECANIAINKRKFIYDDNGYKSDIFLMKKIANKTKFKRFTKLLSPYHTYISDYHFDKVEGDKIIFDLVLGNTLPQWEHMVSRARVLTGSEFKNVKGGLVHIAEVLPIMPVKVVGVSMLKHEPIFYAFYNPDTMFGPIQYNNFTKLFEGEQDQIENIENENTYFALVAVYCS